MVVLQAVHKVPQGAVSFVDQDLVPTREAFRLRLNGSLDDGIEVLAHRFQWRHGLRKDPQRKRERGESVLEVFDLSGLQVENLEKFAADQSCHHRSGGRNGRDDLACSHLHLVEIRFCDLVVPRPQIGRGGDEGDVEVAVVVLLELSRREVRRGLLAGAERLHLLDHVAGLLVVVQAALSSCVLIVYLDLNLLRSEGRQLDLRSQPRDGLGVALLGDSEVGGVEVGGSLDKLQVQRVAGVELQRLWRPLRAAPEEGALAGAVLQGEGV
mmetsp:Transcript_37252/g.79073  ORF Transcript_37252/g.79073 Transcript_37252/m.79073 type:complete len:268 (+) Transcript_37252:370-1173(+)